MSDWDKYSVNVGLDGNLEAELLVAPDETENGIAVVKHTLPPKKLAAPHHRHTHEDEISYILEGTMEVQEGDMVSTIEAGDCVVKERENWHTFWNPESEPLRFLEMISPGIFAGYFEESAQILTDDDLDDEEMRARLETVHDEYDFEVDPESVPELIERHDLQR